MQTANVRASDGREQRSRRTRAAIVGAWLDIVESGMAAPTARDVAERAGIALRTVFQHFDDLEELHTSAAVVHFSRIEPFLVQIDLRAPVEERVVAFCDSRRRLFERISPVRRAAIYRSMSSNLGTLIRDADEMFERLALAAFENELSAVTDERRNRLVRQALVVSLSWPNWDYLRGIRMLSPDDASMVLQVQCRSLLSVQDPEKWGK